MDLIELVGKKREGFMPSDVMELLTAIGIASKDYVRKEIDKIFNKDKITYINEYKNSKIYDMNFLKSLPYSTEVYAERVIGIIEHDLKTKDYTNTVNLYKLRYKKIYNNFKNKKSVGFHEIMRFISEGMEGNYEFIATQYVFTILGKVKEDVELLRALEFILRDLLIFEIYEENNFNDEIINAQREEINKIKALLGIKKKAYNFDELLNDIMDKDTEELINEGYPKGSFDVQKIGKRSKNIGAMEGFLKFLNIFPYEITKNILLSQKELDKLIANFTYAKMFNKMTDEDDLFRVFIPYLYTYLINKEYKSLKDSYIKNVNQDYLIEVENLKNSLKESKIELDLSKENVRVREITLSNKEKESQKEIDNLKREIALLNNKVKEYDTLKTEVVKLRELSFREANQEDLEEETTQLLSVEQIESLNKLNITIIGGSLPWIKKIREVLNNWTFISTDNINNDLSILRNAELILINTKMSHSLYFKAKSIIDKGNLKYDYINVSSNIDISLNTIYEIVKKYNLI